MRRCVVASSLEKNLLILKRFLYLFPRTIPFTFQLGDISNEINSVCIKGS